MKRCGIRTVLVSCLLLLSDHATAATTYLVRFRPVGTQGLACKLAFDLSHVDGSIANRAELLAFVHDGIADSAVVEGGPGYGDLFDDTNPATMTTLEGQFFANSLIVPFEALGTSLTFQLNLTEQQAASGTFPDEFAMYFIRRLDDVPYATSDELGTDALFAIDITGAAGGELSVFAPMTFIPPNMLALEGTVLEVPSAVPAAGRLRLRSLAPNPSTDGVRIDCQIPEPGGRLRLRVYDAGGRLMAEPYDGYQPAGMWVTHWSATDSKGREVPAGVYIVQVQMGGQSVIRQVVVNR